MQLRRVVGHMLLSPGDGRLYPLHRWLQVDSPKVVAAQVRELRDRTADRLAQCHYMARAVADGAVSRVVPVALVCNQL